MAEVQEWRRGMVQQEQNLMKLKNVMVQQNDETILVKGQKQGENFGWHLVRYCCMSRESTLLLEASMCETKVCDQVEEEMLFWREKEMFVLQKEHLQ